MSAQILRLVELHDDYDALQEQLQSELKEIENVQDSYLNKLKKFMMQHEIWHVEELDYRWREAYEQFLQTEVSPVSYSIYLKGYDRVVIQTLQKNRRMINRHGQFIPAYKNEILFLAYHPNEKIAKQFAKASKKKDLVWDFSRQAPEKMKQQIYKVLHYVIEESECKDTLRARLIGLRKLFDFCVNESIEDIELMDAKQIQQFKETLDDDWSSEVTRKTINFVRKAIFMTNEEINWHANVWYMERFHLQPERVDIANEVKKLSFLEIENQENRQLLKEYMKYSIGVTDLSMTVIRSELICLRRFLREIEKEEDINICEITPNTMRRYFQRVQLHEINADTFNYYVMCILRFFKFLKVRQYVNNIPFDEQRYLKKTFIQHNNRSVDEDVANEILTKLSFFPEVNRLMFLNLWAVGLRISEVCTLKGNAYYIQGQDAWMQVYQTKMKCYKRIAIPMALYSVMQAYIKKHGIKADEYLFKNRKGGAYNSGTFRKQMIRHCNKFHISNGEYAFKAHDYRHTVATFFYNNGVTLQCIRDYLGHDYEEMTRQYVDYMPKKVDEANEDYFESHSLAASIRR